MSALPPRTQTKGTYGYDSWTDLTAKRSKPDGSSKDDPGAGIMDMMKQSEYDQ